MQIKYLLATILFATLFINSSAQLSPDNTFSQDGVVKYAPQPMAHNFATKTAILSNGSIIVAGSSQEDPQNHQVKLWRYTSSGIFDQSFGTNGVAKNNALINMKPFRIMDVLIQDNGKIMVLVEHKDLNTSTYNNTLGSILLMRFNADGTVDNTFNSNGFRKHNPSPAFQYVPLSLAIGPNNSYYVSSQAIETGHFSCPIGFGKWCISKYNNDGSLDYSFNSSGFKQESANKLKANTVTSLAIVSDIKVMQDGKILASGYLHNFDSAFVNFRLNTNGSFDSTYGTNGINLIPVNNLGFGISMADKSKSAIQADNSIVYYTSWINYNPDTTRVYFMRTDANGVGLSNYGTNGFLKTSYQSFNDAMPCVRSNGEILLPNYKKNGTNQSVNFKYITATGQINPLFGTNGLLVTQPITNDVFANASRITDIHFTDNESKVVFITTSSTPTYITMHYGVYRYNFTAPPTIGIGIDQNFLNNDIAVYPNPFNSQMVINDKNQNDNAILNIRIMDLNGRVIVSKEMKNKSTINLNFLSEGNYLLNINSEKGLTSKMISKR